VAPGAGVWDVTREGSKWEACPRGAQGATGCDVVGVGGSVVGSGTGMAGVP
jgi:hypothetical protein